MPFIKKQDLADLIDNEKRSAIKRYVLFREYLNDLGVPACAKCDKALPDSGMGRRIDESEKVALCFMNFFTYRQMPNFDQYSLCPDCEGEQIP